MFILGISAFYHDSSAALLRDGSVVAAVQEERFSRRKHDPGFPVNAVKYCLDSAGITIDDVAYVVFYDKPLVKFERLIETCLNYVPRGWKSFSAAMPLWLGRKLNIPKLIKKELGWNGIVLFTEHHEAHAASAFFPSPFSEAAVVCFDGVGEWATTSWGIGRGNRVELKQRISFPHSIGLLYSSFTYYLGFAVNSDEYKVMGLAPYGEPRYFDMILDRLVDLKDDGSFRLNMDFFNYCRGLTMTNSRFDELFGGPPRKPGTGITLREADLAASIQKVTEELMLGIGRYVHSATGLGNLCMAGGVALNCTGNGRLVREGPFERVWIQPAAGDAGGALGAALAIRHHYLQKPRTADGINDKQLGSYLGPEYADSEVEGFLKENGCPYIKYPEESLCDEVARRLDLGEVIGWFQGRMEFGPRSLGARSIIADARNPCMQHRLNVEVKKREPFRPFAPSVLLERVADWFEFDRESPYMLINVHVKKGRTRPFPDELKQSMLSGEACVPRSDIPAVTHVDYSSRIQTVDGRGNKRYYKLLRKFYERTGCPVVLNTSFNVQGEPIVCAPRDAYDCFMRTGMDTLVMGTFLIEKAAQPRPLGKND